MINAQSRHEKICQNIKKRKPFDTSKVRLQAIAAEAGVSVNDLAKKSNDRSSRIHPKKVPITLLMLGLIVNKWHY